MALSSFRPLALTLSLMLPLGAVAPAFAMDTCRWANDGDCDDPTVTGHLTEACAPGTDNADCGIVALQPLEPMDPPGEDFFSEACPDGMIVMDGSCVDEDLLLEEVEPDTK